MKTSDSQTSENLMQKDDPSVVTHLFPGVYFLPSISQRTVYFPKGPFISQKGPFISQGGRLFPKSKNDK